MGRSILVAVVAAAAGLFGLQAGASAQQPPPNVPPLVGADPALNAASPSGAVYIPGVGFRYVVPGGPRVYGYTAYGPRVYGYTAYGPRVYGYRARANRRACRDHDWWGFERCGRRWW